MSKKSEEILKKLKKDIDTDYFIESAYDIISEIEEDTGFDFVEPFLKLMEENPGADFGQPGPLVHFVEKYYKRGYENLLLISLNRRPTLHTPFMLH